jgi:hypothetical protein
MTQAILTLVLCFFYDRILETSDKHSWLDKAMPEPMSDKMKQKRMYFAGRDMQESGVVVVDKPRHLHFSTPGLGSADRAKEANLTKTTFKVTMINSMVVGSTLSIVTMNTIINFSL